MAALEDTPFEAFFLEGAKGRLFGLHFPATSGPRGKLLCIPPFTEESNRCRVMLGMAARALAHTGWSTLLLDPFGCGDSDGDFEEADWQTWQSDIDTGIGWLQNRPGELALWGTRLGAVMVFEAAQRRSKIVDRLLLWQPVVSGKQMFTQYLRLRIASSRELHGRQETTKELRERLAAGETLEVGGYYISPRLAADLDHVALPSAPDLPPDLRIDWLERVDDDKTELAMGSRRMVAGWQEQGIDVRPCPFHGPPFWQLHERFLAPELVDRTVEALSGS